MSLIFDGTFSMFMRSLTIIKRALSKWKNGVITLRATANILFYPEAINIFANFIGRRDKSTGLLFPSKMEWVGMLAKLKNEKIAAPGSLARSSLHIFWTYSMHRRRHKLEISFRTFFNVFFFAQENHFLTWLAKRRMKSYALQNQ